MWVTARFDVLFKSLDVKKTTNIFSCTFPFFEKATNLFNATGHHACSPTPTKISIDILSSIEVKTSNRAVTHTSKVSNNKNIWPKISVAYFTKLFQFIFSAGGWRMYPFNPSLLLAAYKPSQSCKRASF